MTLAEALDAIENAGQHYRSFVIAPNRLQIAVYPSSDRKTEKDLILTFSTTRGIVDGLVAWRGAETVPAEILAGVETQLILLGDRRYRLVGPDVNPVADPV